jgi:hypothetical protein
MAEGKHYKESEILYNECRNMKVHNFLWETLTGFKRHYKKNPETTAY